MELELEEDFAWEPSVRHTDSGLPKTKTVLQVTPRLRLRYFFEPSTMPVGIFFHLCSKCGHSDSCKWIHVLLTPKCAVGWWRIAVIE